MPHPSRLVEIKCATCGKAKSIPLSQYNKCKSKVFFCSPKCKGISMRNKVSTVCEYCGKEITVPKDRFEKRDHIFCSKKCAGAFSQKRVNVKCDYCGTNIELRPSEVDMYQYHFCDMNCRSKWQSENIVGEKTGSWNGGKCHPLYCGWCGKEILVRAYRVNMYQNIFCDQTCRSKFLSVKNSMSGNPRWNGGTSFLPYPPEFNSVLKQQIRKRDLNQCQMCENVFPDGLHIHHIDYDKEHNDSSNLISLCSSCHGKTHSNRDYWKELFQEMMKERFPD